MRYLAAILTLLTLGAMPAVQAQTEPEAQPAESFTVVYDDIERQITERPELRRALVSRFIDADTTLTRPELAVVYYGQAMTQGYNPDETHQEVTDALNAGDVNLAIALTDEALRRNPVSLPMLFNLYGCCAVSEVPQIQARKGAAQAKILMLCDMITDAGMGISPEMPWPVISEQDMDELLTKYIQVQSELERTDKGDEKAVKVRLNGVADDVILYFDLLLANRARQALKR